MLKQIEGSQGVAQAVALCRPDVVCAYPISPQTHIVENLGLLCRKGVLQDCEYINVESEFAAMSGFLVTSVPVIPIPTPISADLMEGASLTPSPVMAVT